MNASTMEGHFQRIMGDEGQEDWDSPETYEFLNIGLQDIQEEVMAIDQDAFLQWDTADIVKDQRFYARPVSSYYALEIAYSADPSTQKYKPMKVEPFSEIRKDETRSARGEGVEIVDAVEYADTCSIGGKYIYLGWQPTVNVTDGLQIAYTYMITVAVASDVPDLPLYLHYGAVLSAAMAALNETPDEDTKIAKNRQRIVNKIPLYYRKTLAAPEYLRVEGIRVGDGME